MSIGQKQAVVGVILVVGLMAGVGSAWQQSPAQPDHSSIIASMKLRALQSVPVVPTPDITAPFSDAEYNTAADYCLHVLGFIESQQAHLLREVDDCNRRISTPLMAAYYASRPDMEQEVKDLIDLFEGSALLIDDEVGEDVAGLRGLLITANNFLLDWQANGIPYDRECALVAMTFAYVKAKGLITIGQNGFNQSFLNISFDLLGNAWDDIAEHEYNAGMEQINIEAGAHI